MSVRLISGRELFNKLEAIRQITGGILTSEMVDALENCLDGCRNFSPSDPGDAEMYALAEVAIEILRGVLEMEAA